MAEAVPLIYNPMSGGGDGERLYRMAAKALTDAGVEVDPMPTTAPGGARPMASELAEAGHAQIFALGGDGTLSEAADGVLSTERRPTLGFLPAGRGNDLLLHFGIKSLDEAVRRIAAGVARPMDAVRIEFENQVRHSINVFAVGFAAKAAVRANERYSWMGDRSYTAAVLRELVGLRPFVTRLELDDEVVEGPFNLVAACNTTYTGGAMMMAPAADAADGLMDVVALRRVGRVALVNLFRKLFKGKHIGHPRVLDRRVRRLFIQMTPASTFVVDGEVYGTTPVTLTVLPGALDVLL